MPKSAMPFVAALIGALVVSFLMSLAASAAGEPPGATPTLVGLCFGLVLAVVLHNLSGNRKVAAASDEERRAALSFAAEPGRAALYVVRTGFVGKAAGMNFALDGTAFAQLKSPRFTRVSIAPGAHVLVASFGGGLAGQTKPAELSFTAAAGEIVVAHVTMGIGAMKNPLNIARADIEAMRGQILGLQMTKPDAAAL